MTRTSRAAARRTATTAMAACLLAAGPPRLPAQSLVTGAIQGTVRGRADAPLADARVRARDVTTGITRSTATSERGRYLVAFLPPGTYEVFVERFGYRPVRVEGVPVQPGRTVELALALEEAPPPVDTAAVLRFRDAAFRGSRAGQTTAFSRFELARLPETRREAAALARLSALATPALEAEGLPAPFAGVLADGLPFRPARHPDLPATPLAAAAFPLAALDDAELATNGVDVEAPATAGAVLALHGARGTRTLEVRSFGTWSADPLWSSRLFDAGPAGPSELRGGLALAGPIIPDTAHFLVGLEARRAESVMPGPWALEPDAAPTATIARERFGVDLEPYRRPRRAREEAVAGFGRFDWQVTPEHALAVRASFAALPATTHDLGPTRTPSLGAILRGRDIAAAATLTSALGPRVVQELRVGIERSERETLAAAGTGAEEVDDDALPPTTIVSGALAFGADPALPGRFTRSAFRIAQTLHIAAGAHRLKAGLAAELARHDQVYAYGRRGEFLFGGPDEFARGVGTFVQIGGALPAAHFRTPAIAAFLQDTWSAAPGFELTAGLRADLETLPRDEVRLHEAWARSAGLDNTAFPRTLLTVGPRIGVLWDVQERHTWVLRAAAGLYHGHVDPAALAEAITFDTGMTARRGAGPLGAWPRTPDPAATPFTGERIALLAPGLRAPRTARASLGSTAALGPATTLHLWAGARWTDFLIRRRDLNLLPAPATHDQFGRPIYGRLLKQGALLAAAPGSNRRFDGFDVVAALDADGWSRQWALGAALEHDPAGPLAFFARYAYSETTDNLPGARAGGPDAQLSPFPDRLDGEEWAQGRSDFDVPHRLAVGAELELPLLTGIRIAGTYHYRSGYPFTPGFRDGVDANADGSARNDPAFLDDDLPGTAALLRRWPCLRDQTGRFAERNACRAPAVHTLDLRIAIGLVRLRGSTAELVLDGLNLLEPDVGEPDRAVYLVDPARPLATDAQRNVTVPLVANDHFGRPILRRTTGRAIRIGLQLAR